MKANNRFTLPEVLNKSCFETHIVIQVVLYIDRQIQCDVVGIKKTTDFQKQPPSKQHLLGENC